MYEEIRESNLDVNGRRLHSTSKDKASLEEVMVKAQKYHPDTTFSIEPFGVNIKKANHDTLVVTDWEKEEGFSLWYNLANTPDDL